MQFQLLILGRALHQASSSSHLRVVAVGFELPLPCESVEALGVEPEGVPLPPEDRASALINAAADALGGGCV